MYIKYFATGPLMVNTYLVYDDTKKAFVIDPGGCESPMIDFINKEELDLEYIVLTHGHCDHIGGIPGLREFFPEIKVVAHALEDELLIDPDQNSSTMFFGRPLSIKADILVNEGDTLKVGDMELGFIHTPGHSAGGMCIMMGDVCFSGDTLFQGSVGRSDLYGGDWDTLMNSIKEKLYVLPDDTLVLPGHMGKTSIGYEKKYNAFVRA